MKAHEEMLSDLSGVKSVCYIDIQDYVNNEYKNFGGLLEDVQNYFEEIFQIVIDGISEMENESYFDLTSKSYIPLGKELNKNDRLESRYLPGDVNIASMYFIEGRVNIPNQVSDGIYRKHMIYRPVARTNAVCDSHFE